MNARDTDWFRPLWRRVAVTAVCVVWAAWEWFFNPYQDQLWQWIALAAAGICVWTLFVTFDRGGTPPADKPPA